MSCKVIRNYTPFVPTEEDPQVVEEYNRNKMEQPMEQPNKQIVSMLDKNNVYAPILNITREKAEQVVSRHKDFIIFIKVDQQAFNEVKKYRVDCLTVAWSYKQNKAITGYVFAQNEKVILGPEYGIKPYKILKSLNIENEYRSRSQYITPDYPLKAYWVGGHGNQIRPSSTETGYFIVPYNCTIIVKAHSADVAYTEFSYKSYLKLIEMGISRNYPSMWLDELIKQVGTIAIYGPGDKCPEFLYHLNANYQGKNSRWLSGSGIIDFDCIKDTEGLPSTLFDAFSANTAKSKTIVNADQLKSYYLDQYKWSMYPSQNDVELKLDTLFQKLKSTINSTNKQVLFEKVEPTINNLLNTIQIKQSKLCELLPGIYYNFVCRDIEGTYKKIYNVKRTTNKINNNNNIDRIVSFRKNNNTIKEMEYQKKEANRLAIEKKKKENNKKKFIEEQTKKLANEDKKFLQEHIKVFTTFLSEYPAETNENKKKQLSDAFIQYLDNDYERLNNMIMSYSEKIQELQRQQTEDKPEKKQNQTNQDYQKELNLFEEKINEEINNLAYISELIADKSDRDYNRLYTFKENGVDSYLDNIKQDLDDYIEQYSQPNNTRISNSSNSSSSSISSIASSPNNIVKNIKYFGLKNRISEAIGHRRNAIRQTFSNNFYKPIMMSELSNQKKKSNTRNKEIMNRVKASSNKWAAEQKARENANYEEYLRKTKKNNAANNKRINTIKNGKPNINTRNATAPVAGGRRSTKKRRSSRF
jgi:hypothetical protein